MNMLRKQVLKTKNCKTCDYFRMKIEYMNKTLSKFQKSRDK